MRHTDGGSAATTLFGMWREAAAGLGLATLLGMARAGLDITPIVLIGGLALAFRLLADQRGATTKGSTVVGKSGEPRCSTASFDDIGGQESAKRELVEALDFLKRAEAASKLGIRPLKGILLEGPPGTGKTLMAKAAAGYTGSAFVSASGSEFVEMYAGVGAQRVRQLFAGARKAAEKQNKKSAVVFIDEIEVVGGKRGSHSSHLEYDQTLNQILVEMDGIAANEGVRVLVIGATNRADLLDAALLRPGRFDRQVRVDLPDAEGRLQILGLHTRNKPLDEGVDMRCLARDTFGFSGAHLESLTNEAAILALRRGAESIAMADLREAIDKVAMGERLDRRPSDAEMARVAIHETGHALVSEAVRPGSVSVVTVTPRGHALGYMRQAPESDRVIHTQGELEDQIAVCLGGAVSEEVVLGSRSSGATSDLAQAASLAKRLVGLGMSDLGIVSEGDVPGDALHTAVSSILRAQESRVRAMITLNAAAIRPISERLVRVEKMEGDEFRSAVAGATPIQADSCPSPEAYLNCVS